MDCAKAIAEVGQSLAGKFERRQIAIDADHARRRRRFENRLAVPAEPNRAVNKETASLGSEEVHRLS
jgi:hypothetical protein